MSKLRLIGEYINEEGNGITKDLLFIGEYLNGKGKEYFDDKLEFEGEYLYDYRLKGK